MTIDPTLVALASQLYEDEEAVSSTLVGIAELLNQWSESWRTGQRPLLADAEARAFVRARLVECIDRDPTRPLAATAIWVLGKLFDRSLEPYYARLASIFVQDDRWKSHMHQTIIALDNLDLLPSPFEGDWDEVPSLKMILDDYLRQRDDKKCAT